MNNNQHLHFTAAFPGKYIQGEHALDSLPELIRRLGSRGLVLASPTALNKILPGISFPDLEGSMQAELFRGECCEAEIQRVAGLIRTHRADILVGMGGGKAIDTAKIAADRAGVPVIIVPTIASTDAPCSGCAVIYSEKGVFESVYYQKMNPQVVLVDSSVIARAPARFLVAGMGDALATWFEARSCERTQSKNECGGKSTMTGLNLASLCFDTLLEFGMAAKLACENQVVTPALDRIIEANILLSGIGFESSGLATAHSVHNGLSALEETHTYYHGEKVAFGVVTGLQVGLPVTFAGIGLKDVNRSRLMLVAEKACAPAEGIHHEAMEVTPEKVVQAMVMADAMGRAAAG